jgi:hypothetical protein
MPDPALLALLTEPLRVSVNRCDPSRNNMLCSSPGGARFRLPPGGGAMLRLLRAPFQTDLGAALGPALGCAAAFLAPAGASFTIAMPGNSKRSCMHSENEQSGMVAACSRFESGLVRVGNQRGKVLGRVVLGLAHQVASGPSSGIPRARTYCAPRRGRSIPSPAWRRRYAETPADTLSGRSRGCTRSCAGCAVALLALLWVRFSLMSPAPLRS